MGLPDISAIESGIERAYLTWRLDDGPMMRFVKCHGAAAKSYNEYVTKQKERDTLTADLAILGVTAVLSTTGMGVFGSVSIGTIARQATRQIVKANLGNAFGKLLNGGVRWLRHNPTASFGLGMLANGLWDKLGDSKLKEYIRAEWDSTASLKLTGDLSNAALRGALIAFLDRRKLAQLTLIQRIKDHPNINEQMATLALVCRAPYFYPPDSGYSSIDIDDAHAQKEDELLSNQIELALYMNDVVDAPYMRRSPAYHPGAPGETFPASPTGKEKIHLSVTDPNFPQQDHFSAMRLPDGSVLGPQYLEMDDIGGTVKDRIDELYGLVIRKDGKLAGPQPVTPSRTFSVNSPLATATPKPEKGPSFYPTEYLGLMRKPTDRQTLLNAEDVIAHLGELTSPSMARWGNNIITGEPAVAQSR